MQAVPTSGAGTLAVWGVTGRDCTTPVNTTYGDEAGGPWTAVSATSDSGGDNIAISAAGKLVRVRASIAPFDIPPALDNERAVAVDHYGVAKAGAVTSTGAVQIWGSTRTYQPGRWEPADLGGKAVDIALGTAAAVVLLDDGTIGVIDGFAPAYEKIPGIDDVAEIRADSVGYTLRIEGGGLRSFTFNGVETTDTLPAAVRGDSLTDPIVDFTLTKSAVTQSGNVISWSGIPAIDDYVLPAGAKVTDIATAGQSVDAWRAALTDQGEILVWGAGTNSACIEPMTTLPEELEGKRITALEGDLNAFYAIAADPLVDLSETAKPTIAGTPQVGSVLTGTPATFDGSPDSIANQWLANGEAIEGANGTTLTLTQAHLGQNISFRSTAKRGDDTLVSSPSTPVGPVTVQAPAQKTTPTVTAGGVAQTPFGSAVSMSASVTGAKGAGTGTVTFSGAGINATAALSGGQASVALPSTLAVGSTAVTVSYSGDANYVAASTAKTLTIVKASTSSVSAKVTKKPKKNKAGKVQVTASSRLSVRPGGKVTVTFTKGKKKITRNGTLRNGKVIINTPKLAKGTWKITAQYKGDSRYNPRSAKAIKAKVK